MWERRMIHAAAEGVSGDVLMDPWPVIGFLEPGQSWLPRRGRQNRGQEVRILSGAHPEDLAAEDAHDVVAKATDDHEALACRSSSQRLSGISR